MDVSIFRSYWMMLGISLLAAWPAVAGEPVAAGEGGPAKAQRPAKQPHGNAAERPPAKPKRRKPEKVIDLAPELATHREVDPLGVSFQRLTALRLRADGMLLAADAGAKLIRLIDPEGRVAGQIELDFAPEALAIAPDGTLYCGGQGQLARLDEAGRVVKKVNVPDEVAPVRRPEPSGEKPERGEENPSGEYYGGQWNSRADAGPSGSQSMAAEQSQSTAKPPAPRRRRKKTYPKRISGIAVTDRDVFVAFGAGWSRGSTSKLYRFDRQLENPRKLAEALRGCCQRCDIVARDGVLYVAENAAHRIVLFDRDGNLLGKWGEQGRDKLEAFGACCNPMNLAFDHEGVLYTAESGVGRVKRYTPDGKFLGLVGYIGTTRFWDASSLAAACSNIAIAVTADGSRVYVMDYQNNRIRVLEKKPEAGTSGGRAE